MISYVEDKNLIAYCFSKKDYTEIDKRIDREKLNFSITKEDKLFGYKIKKIKQLTNIYEKPFFSIEFCFKNVNLFPDNKEEKIYKVLMKEMMKEIRKNKGYYIIKIHSSNTNLISAFNKTFMNSKNKMIFAGGTICYAIEKYSAPEFVDEVRVIKADSASLRKNMIELEKLGGKSFTKYSGQYHISHLTREKAPLIYRNWIKDNINDGKNTIFLAKLREKIVGFLTAEEKGKTVEIALNAVEEKHRGRKIYEKLVRAIVYYGISKGKIITVSTPFDNYPPQRVWINIGFKPYHSFYLFHYINE